ncbi:MAG: saccharopine dehydrogenase NADP-binding domain-containing protein, partial [Deltaproteobacteria bacterium]
MRILVLGGYGVFGGRLIELLADRSDLTILVAGRTLRAADAFVTRYRGTSKLIAIAGDRSAPDALLDTHKPQIVIDASGPFQTYGDDPYALPRAAISRGIDYFDFADGADFVDGFGALDELAKANSVVALSGVSSFPVLTYAVLQEMQKQITVTHVAGGIAPSPYAGVGLNVMRAVVGYAGSPVQLMRNGRATTGVGLGESRRFTIAVPGALPLGNIRFSLVDVPDLRLIPAAMPDVQTLWMGAGPVPESLHRMLNLLAKLRHALHLPSLAPLSGLFYRALNLMKFGEHRGGMFVEAKGDGQHLSWHLLAEGDAGPLIPSMAIEHLVRQFADGHRP